MASHRFLIVIYPAQSHINPALQFDKRLISNHNAHVTLAITFHMHRRMPLKLSFPGLSLVTFSDSYDDGFSVFDGNYTLYASSLSRCGSDFITSKTQQGLPFTCLTYTLLVPWAHEVARAFHLPIALLWIEPATVFAIAHHYFQDYDRYINEKVKQDHPTTLPGLPLVLAPSDIPTFLLVSESNPVSFIFPLFEEQFRVLDKEVNPIVEDLEPHAML